MTKEESELVEQKIVTEENWTKSQSNKPETAKKFPKINQDMITSIKNWPSHFKKPKLITIVILAGVIFVIYLGLILLSKNTTLPPQPQTQVIVSPSPQASEEPTASTISQKVNSYNQKIDDLDNLQKKLRKPIVNLEITFD